MGERIERDASAFPRRVVTQQIGSQSVRTFMYNNGKRNGNGAGDHGKQIVHAALPFQLTKAARKTCAQVVDYE